MSDPNLTLYAPFAVDRTLVSRIGPTFGIVRTTESRFFNAGGLIETAAAGEAVFEYDPITRISLGLRVEESRENVCLHNRDGTNAVWVKLNMTAVKDQVGEDGVANSASSLLATAGNATAIQAFTIGSTAQTGTFSIKRLIGTGDVDITIDDGVTFTTVNINSLTYTRFNVTQTLANPDIGVRLVTSGDKIAIDFQGLEAGSFPTSRIATVASSVTRNQDVVTTTDVTWLNVNAGTLYILAAEAFDTAKISQLITLSDNSSSDEVRIRRDSGGASRMSVAAVSATQVNMTIGSVWGDTVDHGLVAAWALNDAEHYVDGTRSGTGDQTVDLPVGLSKLNIGSRLSGTDPFNGHVKDVRYYNVRKFDAAGGNGFLEDLSNGIINEDSINLSRNISRPLVRNIARPY